LKTQQSVKMGMDAQLYILMFINNSDFFQIEIVNKREFCWGKSNLLYCANCRTFVNMQISK
jgi:hypothetical protein